MFDILNTFISHVTSQVCKQYIVGTNSNTNTYFIISNINFSRFRQELLMISMRKLIELAYRKYLVKGISNHVTRFLPCVDWYSHVQFSKIQRKNDCNPSRPRTNMKIGIFQVITDILEQHIKDCINPVLKLDLYDKNNLQIN